MIYEDDWLYAVLFTLSTPQIIKCLIYIIIQSFKLTKHIQNLTFYLLNNPYLSYIIKMNRLFLAHAYIFGKYC